MTLYEQLLAQSDSTHNEHKTFLVVELALVDDVNHCTTNIIDEDMPAQGDAKSYLEEITAMQRMALEIATLITECSSNLAGVAVEGPKDPLMKKLAGSNPSRLARAMKYMSVRSAILALEKFLDKPTTRTEIVVNEASKDSFTVINGGKCNEPH